MGKLGSVAPANICLTLFSCLHPVAYIEWKLSVFRVILVRVFPHCTEYGPEWLEYGQFSRSGTSAGLLIISVFWLTEYVIVLIGASGAAPFAIWKKLVLVNRVFLFYMLERIIYREPRLDSFIY